MNDDTFYLNSFIRAAHNGTFAGLGNAKLRAFGKMQKFYPGIPEIFQKTKDSLKDDKSYSEYGIQVENYIVSTGFAEVILTCNNVVTDTGCCQLNLFDQAVTLDALEQDRKRQKAVLDIKHRFGKNALLRGMDLQDAATTRERNLHIGGHKSGA